MKNEPYRHEATTPDVLFLVKDAQHTRLAARVDDWNATTLLACASEDPQSWSDLAVVWPRYRAGASLEFLDALPFSVTDASTAVERLSDDGAWIVMDLTSQRIFTGRRNDPVERKGCYIAGEQDHGWSEISISVNLPPWWELHTHVSPTEISKPRIEATDRPLAMRHILWGPPLSQYLADRLVTSFHSDPWLRRVICEGTDLEQRNIADKLNERTVALHRDWLMTPRADLQGRMPRECLHGGMRWIESLIHAQKLRLLFKEPLHAIPENFSGFDDAPPGRAEVCMYFDLCRQLIDAGWSYLQAKATPDQASITSLKLAAELSKVQEAWMHQSQPDGILPAHIVATERQRIPRVMSAEDGHVLDCNCPICLAMADGEFGPGFMEFDGYLLELDNEFAFSLADTREQWEEEQQEFAAMNAQMSEQSYAADDEEEDEFASSWKNCHIGDVGIPGDNHGHLALSFFLAEIIGTLEQSQAPQSEIDDLNSAFRDYRTATPQGRSLATRAFKAALEELAQRHTELVGRSADLQQRLDETLRSPALPESEEGY